MIVSLPDFASVNRLEDLAAGRYFVVESVYRFAGVPPCHAVLSEIVLHDTGRSVGADVQVVLHDGTSLFRDFAIAPDGAWRESYGAKAPALADLLPPELMEFTLGGRQAIAVIHDGKGELNVASDLDGKHGS